MKPSFGFVPADNKLEAVARISALTDSGPEDLGPGSKERKSVVVNLANGLKLGIDSKGTKQEVARRIANALGQTWTSRCESVGQTLTLYGLNLLLEGSTVFLARKSLTTTDQRFDDVNDEAKGIGEIVAESVPPHWEGKSCVEEMRKAESGSWRQTEWPGWYLEFRAIPVLVNRLGGGPLKVRNTKFDYSLRHVWDLKAHSVYGTAGPAKPNNVSQLNDQEAMRSAINAGGLGVFVLSGEPRYEGLQFTEWHRRLRGRSGESRRILKSAFAPIRLDAFFIPDNGALNTAASKSQILEFRQGRQPSGKPRKPKYSINVDRCRDSDLHVYEHVFSSGTS
jgi:hypothetical protein